MLLTLALPLFSRANVHKQRKRNKRTFPKKRGARTTIPETCVRAVFFFWKNAHARGLVSGCPGVDNKAPQPFRIVSHKNRNCQWNWSQANKTKAVLLANASRKERENPSSLALERPRPPKITPRNQTDSKNLFLVYGKTSRLQKLRPHSLKMGQGISC